MRTCGCGFFHAVFNPLLLTCLYNRNQIYRAVRIPSLSSYTAHAIIWINYKSWVCPWLPRHPGNMAVSMRTNAPPRYWYSVFPPCFLHFKKNCRLVSIYRFGCLRQASKRDFGWKWIALAWVVQWMHKEDWWSPLLLSRSRPRTCVDSFWKFPHRWRWHQC